MINPLQRFDVDKFISFVTFFLKRNIIYDSPQGGHILDVIGDFDEEMYDDMLEYLKSLASSLLTDKIPSQIHQQILDTVVQLASAYRDYKLIFACANVADTINNINKDINLKQQLLKYLKAADRMPSAQATLGIMLHHLFDDQLQT